MWIFQIHVRSNIWLHIFKEGVKPNILSHLQRLSRWVSLWSVYTSGISKGGVLRANEIDVCLLPLNPTYEIPKLTLFKFHNGRVSVPHQ